jgi:hypothetical protein
MNVAKQGRFGDSMLLHVNPMEVKGLASAMPITVNPQTGQPEAFLPFLAPILGQMLGTAFLPSIIPALAGKAALAGAVGSGLAQYAATGDLKKSILGAATGFGLTKALQGASAAASAASETTKAASDAAVAAGQTAADAVQPVMLTGADAVKSGLEQLSANPNFVGPIAPPIDQVATAAAQDAARQAAVGQSLQQSANTANLVQQAAQANPLPFNVAPLPSVAPSPSGFQNLKDAFASAGTIDPMTGALSGQGSFAPLQGLGNLAEGASQYSAFIPAGIGMGGTAILESQEAFQRYMAGLSEAEKQRIADMYARYPEMIPRRAAEGGQTFMMGGTGKLMEAAKKAHEAQARQQYSDRFGQTRRDIDDGRGGDGGGTYGGNLTTPYVPERVALPVDPAYMAGFMPEQTYFGSMNPSATELQNPFGTPQTPYTQGTGVDDSGVGATGPVQIPATPFNPTMMPSYQQFYGSAAQGVPQVQDPNMPLEQFTVQPFVPPVVDDGGSSGGEDNGGDDGGSGGGDNGGSGGGDDGGGSGGNIGGGIPGIKGSRAIIPEAPFMPDYFNQEAIARMNRESMMQPMQNGGDTNIDIDKLPNEGLKKLAQEAPEVVEKMAAKTDKFQGGGGTLVEDASMSMSDILNDPLTQQVIAFIRGDVADDRVVNQFIEKYGISEFVNLRNSILQSIQPNSQTEGMINSNSGDGMSDNIGGVIGDPSRNGERVAVSQDEFIVPADVVSMIGNGSSDAGAKELYSMMDRVRQESIGKKEQINQINPDKVLPA